VQYEGEEPHQASPEHDLAIRAYNMLFNGQGGIDWSGLPYVTAVLGFDDAALEQLMHRLTVIKLHCPPKPESE
jgi:hypothetical protein